MNANLNRRSVLLGGLGALSAMPLLSGCGTTSESGGGKSATKNELEKLRMMIPNKPGGGYDQTGRDAVRVMEDEKITGRFEVFNVTGASGTVALARLMNEKGTDDLMMAMGLGVVGASFTSKSKARVSDATPLARLIEESEGVIVPANSPYKDIDQLVAAWKKDPKSIAVGGGSAPGGPDHLFPMELAREVGIQPRSVNYVSYDGGGDLLPALLGSKVGFATSGIGEYAEQIKSGRVRVLATSGERRVKDVKAPTLKEAGIDLTFINWRGVLAPPGISEARSKELIGYLTEMHDSPAWKNVLKTRDWTDAWMTGGEFGTFLKSQDGRVQKTLKELKLTS